MGGGENPTYSLINFFGNVFILVVTRGAITSIQHSKSYTCTVLHGPEATTRYYGAKPAPTVASRAQQLDSLLSSAFA